MSSWRWAAKKLGHRLCFQSRLPVMVSKSIKHVIPEGNLHSEYPHLPTIVKKKKDCNARTREQIWWSAEKKMDLEQVTGNLIKFLKNYFWQKFNPSPLLWKYWPQTVLKNSKKFCQQTAWLPATEPVFGVLKPQSPNGPREGFSLTHTAHRPLSRGTRTRKSSQNNPSVG